MFLRSLSGKRYFRDISKIDKIVETYWNSISVDSQSKFTKKSIKLNKTNKLKTSITYWCHTLLSAHSRNRNYQDPDLIYKSAIRWVR